MKTIQTTVANTTNTLLLFGLVGCTAICIAVVAGSGSGAEMVRVIIHWISN